MNFATLLRVLYGNDRRAIIKAINQSVYASDHKTEKDEYAVHTGFSFTMQNNKKMELLYHPHTKTIIRQVLRRDAEEMLPSLTGVVYVKHGSPYFNGVRPYIFTECHIEDDELSKYSEIEDLKVLSKQWKNLCVAIKYSSEPHTNLNLFINGLRNKEIPLNRLLFGKIYFNGDTFSDLQSNDRDDEDYIHTRPRFGQYAGSYAQDEAGLSDDFINDVLDGDPDAYWNID